LILLSWYYYLGSEISSNFSNLKKFDEVKSDRLLETTDGSIVSTQKAGAAANFAAMALAQTPVQRDAVAGRRRALFLALAALAPPLSSQPPK
jgi:hypothetical protein